MKFTKIILSLFLIFSLVSNLFSQKNDSGSDTTRTNGLYDGSWSVQFRITNNFTLSSFNGANLALKYHFTKNSAIRFGVTLRTLNDDMSSDNQYTGDPDKTDENIAINRNNFEITIKPLYIYYPKIKKSVLLYLGTGPYIGYGKSKYQLDSDVYNADTLLSSTHDNNDNYIYSIGIAAIAGVEVFVTNYLSLHAEYGSSFYYSYSEKKRDRLIENSGGADNSVINTVTKRDGFSFSATSVLFGVSLYF